MIPIQQYFNENNLFDEATLLAEAERHGVKVKPHPTMPRLKVLTYTDEVQYGHTWDGFNTQCRGLVIDTENKRIASHPLNKFWNLGEMPETAYGPMVEKGAFTAIEKLDGTMLNFFWDEPSTSWQASTRSEFGNEYATWAWTQVLCNTDLPKDHTYVFEILTPQFRNVINYEQKPGYPSGLYLLAARHRETDRMLSNAELDALCAQNASLSVFGRPKTYPFDSIDAVVEACKNLTFMDEGFVLYYPDGLMVKVKGAEYLKVHRLLWNYTDDRVLEILQNNTEMELHEYLVGVPEEFSKDILAVIADAKQAELEYTGQIYEWFEKAPAATRKEFALWVKAEVPAELQEFLFKVLDSKGISRERMYQKFRQGTLRW